MHKLTTQGVSVDAPASTWARPARAIHVVGVEGKADRIVVEAEDAVPDKFVKYFSPNPGDVD